MTRIVEVVQELVRGSPFLSEALSEGLINVSALARKIRPVVEERLGKEIKQGAIVMAVNRLHYGDLTYVEKDLKRFFRKVKDISVRSSLLDYTFANSETLLEKQTRLLDLISRFPKAFYTFSVGISETTIIVTDALEEHLETLFSAEKLLDKEKDLSSITLILPTENRSLYGVYYYILKALAWNGINLVELISTSNEFTIVVGKEDLDKAFSVLIRLRGG